MGTVNIGSRQDGRLKSASVIDCAPNRRAISEALGELCDQRRVLETLQGSRTHTVGAVRKRTVTVIEGWEPQCGNKRFYDLNVTSDEVRRVV